MSDPAERDGRSGHGEHEVGWDRARALAAALPPLAAAPVPLREAVGAVIAADAVAERPVPHYDSSAMDGWATAGPPPWRVTTEDVLVPGQAHEVVTGGALPVGTEAVVPAEHGLLLDGLLDAPHPEPRAHLRPAGEEARRGSVLVAAGTRLSPAHVAVLAIAGTDAVTARRPPRVGFVLTGDEVVVAGTPVAGRVRDAFDPLLPLAVARLGAVALPPARVGDDPHAIRAAIDAFGDADVVVTVGGTGRSRADRLREALVDARIVFDGVAMRPGHPALLALLPGGRPLLALPGNPLAAVTVLLSFLPPLVDALTGSGPEALPEERAGADLAGRPAGTTLVPCAATPAGIVPAPAARPNMLRGLAASAVLAVIPPEGVRAGTPVPVIPLPW